SRVATVCRSVWNHTPDGSRWARARSLMGQGQCSPSSDHKGRYAAGSGPNKGEPKAVRSPGRRRVFVVVAPPPVRSCLRVALRRVLPLLLATERGYIEVAPGGAQRLVAARVDEIGAEHLSAVADERIMSVPLVDPEVFVPIIGDRVPGNVLPSHPLLQALDLRLRSARGVGEGRVAGVEVGEVADL